ncbi:hypothetical protein LSAT2_002434 [Lamellibrachia satsuma]|nr:hypothetical protein LSAT2_002434 [Lamellibrachia satsuma]
MSSKTTSDNDILGECSLVLSDPFKCGYFVSLSFLLLGIVFLSVGMLRPRPYVFDPNMAARDMEAIEMHYVQLSRRVWYACSHWTTKIIPLPFPLPLSPALVLRFLPIPPKSFFTQSCRLSVGLPLLLQLSPLNTSALVHSRSLPYFPRSQSQLLTRFDLVTVAGMVSVTAGGIVFTINLVIALWNLDTSPSVLDQHRSRPDESVRLRPVPGTNGNNYGSSQSGLDG